MPAAQGNAVQNKYTVQREGFTECTTQQVIYTLPSAKSNNALQNSGCEAGAILRVINHGSRRGSDGRSCVCATLLLPPTPEHTRTRHPCPKMDGIPWPPGAEASGRHSLMLRRKDGTIPHGFPRGGLGQRAAASPRGTQPFPARMCLVQLCI